MALLSNLRNKRIVQIVISYAAAGWVLLQVADQLIERDLLPDVVYVALLIWIAAGVPAAILIGWHHGEKGKQYAPRSEVLSLFALTLIALLGSGFAVRNDLSERRVRAAAEHPLDLRSVAVMYLRDASGDSATSYIADGLTEELITALRSVRELDVLSKHATSPFRDTDIPLDSVATLLSVGTIVDGTLERRGDNIAVTLQLIDGKSGTVVERTKIEKPAAELLAVRDGVVEVAANLLRQWIGKEVRLRRDAQGTTVREAWALVQRAEKLRKEAEAAVRAEGPAAGAATFARAMQLLQEAQNLDKQWPEPAVMQASITYRRSRLSAAAGDIKAATDFIEAGLQQAEAALALANNEPRGLELRGTLRYFKWLLNITPHAQERAALLANARKDLEAATGLDASLASAFSTLSHLLYQDDLSSSVVMARQAYEADAYLEVANEVIWRLFYGNFDLGNFTQSIEWCQKGAERFPDDFRFAYCELRLMAAPALDPDPARAWQLAFRIDSLAPAPRKPFETVRARMAVGGVLARAQLRDSADAVLKRARTGVTVAIDPGYDLLSFEAHMRLLLNDRDGAFELLRRGVLAN